MSAEPTGAELLARARAATERRNAARVPVDYAALNKLVRQQKAALTRAKNTGDPEKVAEVVAAAVRAWNQPGCMWPDNWSLWERTLNDMLPFHQQVDIRELA